MPVSMRYGSGGNVGGRGGNSSLLTLLWDNPNPENSFAAQTINIDLSAYDWFAVRAKFSLVTPQDLPLYIFSVDETAKRIFSASDNNRIGVRIFTYDMENMTLAISGATYNGAANNSSVIPLEIYGVNL